MVHPAVAPISTTKAKWLGSVAPADTAVFLDHAMLLIMGGIPWQVYFQRVLASKSARRAQILSFTAGIGCVIMAIPPVLIGAIGASANWSATAYNGSESLVGDELKLTLPLVLQYLTPTAVSFIGLGAVSAAVMSSTDSIFISSSSLLTRNVVKALIWKTADERAQIWIMRGFVVVLGIASTLVSIYVNKIYVLFFLCSDLIYCMLFPQLVLTLYMQKSNTYGSLVGYLLALFFRMSSGEPLIQFPALIRFPGYVDHPTNFYQRFPVRTFAMLVNLITMATVSMLTHWLFTSERLPAKADIFHCVVDQPSNDNYTMNGDTITEGETLGSEPKLMEVYRSYPQQNDPTEPTMLPPDYRKETGM